jgi:hypothetical protein
MNLCGGLGNTTKEFIPQQEGFLRLIASGEIWWSSSVQMLCAEAPAQNDFVRQP